MECNEKDGNFCKIKKKYVTQDDCNNCKDFKQPDLNENLTILVD